MSPRSKYFSRAWTAAAVAAVMRNPGFAGVRVSVTNALSKRLEVEVKRDGRVHRIVFAGGDVADKLR